MSREEEPKIFNDPIHGHIELHPLCVKIIDTPQFQRLRFIKQLGGCYFVFPGASHNRFEHSLGVCHLAGQLARVLQQNHPEFGIKKEDVLCVEIAGLCHDLGHGPFSHLFDGNFMPKIKGKPDLDGWKHEDASVMMFDHLVKENNLETEFEYFELKEHDRQDIKIMMKGRKKSGDSGRGKGGHKDKSFLYDIVSNKENGIDVDKWDYFARDCYMLGIKNSFDHNRLMKFARVIKVGKYWQICFRDKEAFNLYEMFHTRFSLHKRALQHKVTKVIEDMITDAMFMAHPYIKIPGTKGKLKKMTDCVKDMEAYTNLTDDILRQILLSRNKKLTPSKTIINNVLCRKLYKFVCDGRPKSTDYIDKEHMEKAKCNLMEHLEKKGGLKAKDIHIQVVTIDYGMKDENPMDKVRFYKKTDPNKAIKVPKHQVSQMLPEKFAEQIIRVFCKDPAADKDSQKHKDVRTHFEKWCKKRCSKWVCLQQSQGSTESEQASPSKIPRKQ